MAEKTDQGPRIDSLAGELDELGASELLARVVDQDAQETSASVAETVPQIDGEVMVGCAPLRVSGALEPTFGQVLEPVGPLNRNSDGDVPGGRAMPDGHCVRPSVPTP